MSHCQASPHSAPSLPLARREVTFNPSSSLTAQLRSLLGSSPLNSIQPSGRREPPFSPSLFSPCSPLRFARLPSRLSLIRSLLFALSHGRRSERPPSPLRSLLSLFSMLSPLASGLAASLSPPSFAPSLRSFPLLLLLLSPLLSLLPSLLLSPLPRLALS